MISLSSCARPPCRRCCSRPDPSLTGRENSNWERRSGARSPAPPLSPPWRISAPPARDRRVSEPLLRGIAMMRTPRRPPNDAPATFLLGRFSHNAIFAVKSGGGDRGVDDMPQLGVVQGGDPQWKDNAAEVTDRVATGTVGKYFRRRPEHCHRFYVLRAGEIERRRDAGIAGIAPISMPAGVEP